MCLEGHTGMYLHVEAGKDFSLRDCEQVFALLTQRVRCITQSVISSPGFCFPPWNVGAIAGSESVPLVPRTLLWQNKRAELLGCPGLLGKVQQPSILWPQGVQSHSSAGVNSDQPLSHILSRQFYDTNNLLGVEETVPLVH